MIRFSWPLKVAGRDAAPSLTSVGSRRPVYATGLGKAPVAFADADAIQENLRVPFRRFTPYTMVTSNGAPRSVRRPGLFWDP